MRGDRTLDPVRPNAGIERSYARRLTKLIEEMHRSVLWWVRAAYRRRAPEIHRLRRRVAQDVSPTAELVEEMNRLGRRWERRFNTLAKELAQYFATQAATRSDKALATALKRAGVTVQLKTTRAVNDVLRATIEENVALIRSIPERYLDDVRGSVMRSVQRGRDLQLLVDDLQNRYHATRRRAELIARDQNNKATAVLVNARHIELGLTEAVWIHSGGGRHPRPSHLKAGRDKVRYDTRVGWYDPEVQEYVLPGQLINCRCVSRPIVAGLS